MYRCFNKIGNSDNILSWKSKGLSDDTIKPPSTSDNSLSLSVDYLGVKRRVEFAGSCFKQDKTTYDHKNIVSISIVYELGASSSRNNDPILKSFLFGTVTLTMNAGIDKYEYSSYGI